MTLWRVFEERRYFFEFMSLGFLSLFFLTFCLFFVFFFSRFVAKKKGKNWIISLVTFVREEEARSLSL